MSEDAISEAVVNFATALEAACVDLKRRIGQQHGVGIKEETFTSLVGWTKSQGSRIGDFEFTTREANNNSDAFNHAYSILKANSATIKQHFSEKHWRYYYWIWPEGKADTIYRKERKPNNPHGRMERNLSNVKEAGAKLTQSMR